MQENIVLYDGECNLCNSIRTRIEEKDPEKVFHFIPLKSKRGEKLFSELNADIRNQNSLVYLESSTVFTKSDAVLQMLTQLRSFRLLKFLLKISPKVIRNKAYDIVARLR